MYFLMKYHEDTDFKNIFTKAIELYNKVKGNIKI